MSFYENNYKSCSQCGQPISAGMKFCSHCGAAATPDDTETASLACFTYGDRLRKEEIAKTFPGKHRSCAVCGTPHPGTRCPQCDFDESCNYELFPTLQLLDENAHPISYWKEQRTPNAIRAIAMLRKQGWDYHVLNAVKKILDLAEKGEFTHKHTVEIQRQSERPPMPKPPVPKPSAPAKIAKTCSICGTSNEANRQYCVGCGVKLNRAVSKK